MNYSCICFFVLTPVSVIFAEPEVTIGLGKVKGKTVSEFGKKIYKFLGIPYAIPPVGDLRFRKPLELTKKWNQTLIAQTKPKMCIQIPNGIDEISEDCLYLNIWTPKLENHRNPVLIWIHGGRYLGGSANEIDATQLSAFTNTVVVQMNYRLNVFGFIYGNNSEEMPGNMGLYDQRMAMKWVNKYIREFGGDKNRITICGNSAGATSVTHHLMSKDSWPLFKRAFPMSGTAMDYIAVNGKDVALKKAKLFANDVGCKVAPNTDALQISTINCLRKIDANDLLAASLRGVTISPGLDFSEFAHLFLPVFPESFVPKAPREIWKQKEIKPNAEVIIGTVYNEFSVRTIFKSGDLPSDAIRRITNTFPPDMNKLLTSEQIEELISIQFRGIDEKEERDDAWQAAAQLSANILFQCPANKFSKVFSSIESNTVYQLVLTYKPKTSRSFCERKYPCHSDDVPLTFGEVTDSKDKKVSRMWMKFIKHFATKGNVFWDSYYKTNESKVVPVYYNFDGNRYANNTRVAFRHFVCKVWDSMVIN